ncbi:hypothetical protein AX15_003017 [Amanita polypyramis BW_CC]|nr:hypothetical protein AX15_003017 [Amanita polypyramis BW_CC]
MQEEAYILAGGQGHTLAPYCLRKDPKVTHPNILPIPENIMNHVNFPDEVLIYAPQNMARQPSGPRPIRPSENVRSVPRRPSPPEHRPSIIPAMRPLATVAVPHVPTVQMQEPCSAPPPLLYRFTVPLPSPTYRTASVDQNTYLPQPTAGSESSSIEESFDSGKTPLSNENRIFSIFKDICYGHDDCIGYEIFVLPSSLLLDDEMEMYKAFPATDPLLPLLILEVAGLPVALKVQAGDTDFVTVWDVLDTIFQHRNYLGDKQFYGLSTTADGLGLQLHLRDIGDD